jgi:sigma-54 specific flagellar transcriptional regulator A
LIEGELFGHEKGAFTGAIANRKGKFEQAQNGTLFLDEIGEMPLALQVRLLRALEEKVIQRVGSEKDIQLNVRIVAATRANLEEMVHNRLFREDLYYRLNVLRIHLPTLKERKDDIPLLARHFLERAFSETDRKKPYPIFTPESLNLLMEQLWKGNVRELRNLITRIAILLPIEIYQILPTHLVPHFPQQDYFTSSYYNEAEDSQPRQRTTSTPFRQIPAQTEFLSSYQEKTKEQEGVFIPLGMSLKKAEEKIIDLSLEVYQGNRTKVAKVLGIGLRTLRRRLNEQK